MKRLIDAYSAKEALEYTLVGDVASLAQHVIDSQPTVDAVPVVRCRECKLHTSSAFYPDRLFCQEHGRYVDPDGYCYLGERKEGAE